jgi:hypothetical protein
MVITIAGLVSLIVTLLVFGCIVGLLFYLISIVPIPDPYRGWIKVLLQVLVVLVLIGMLLGFVGYPIVRIR